MPSPICWLFFALLLQVWVSSWRVRRSVGAGQITRNLGMCSTHFVLVPTCNLCQNRTDVTNKDWSKPPVAETVPNRTQLIEVGPQGKTKLETRARERQDSRMPRAYACHRTTFMHPTRPLSARSAHPGPKASESDAAGTLLCVCRHNRSCARTRARRTRAHAACARTPRRARVPRVRRPPMSPRALRARARCQRRASRARLQK